jgi:hypothetical protein
MWESLRDKDERTFSRPGISPRPVGLPSSSFTRRGSSIRAIRVIRGSSSVIMLGDISRERQVRQD